MQYALSPHNSVISSMNRVFPDPLAPMMVMRCVVIVDGALFGCSDAGNVIGLNAFRFSVRKFSVFFLNLRYNQ